MAGFIDYLKRNKKPKAIYTYSFREVCPNSSKLFESLEDTDEDYYVPEEDQDKDYHSYLHRSEDLAPQSLTDEHKKVLFAYTKVSTDNKTMGAHSSDNMNNLLRKMYGQKSDDIKGGHSEENVMHGIKKLDSAFDDDNNLNKVPIRTYSGIPKHVGRAINQLEDGDQVHFPAFTSTSTRKDVAHHFAKVYNSGKQDDERHVMHLHLEPHAGMSSFTSSGHSQEHEVVLPKGAKATYSHTTRSYTNNGDTVVYNHHFRIHPAHERLDLSEY